MFIEEYANAVPLDLCERIIAYFEASPALMPSVVRVQGVDVVKAIRSGTLLKEKNGGEAWRAIHAALIPALQSSMKSYVLKYPGLATLASTDELECTPPLIERVQPGQGFDWHNDQTGCSSERVVAGLLYLRSIAAGGHTEFAHQNAGVVPEAGKIVLFPPFWTHYHRGVSPASESKYVASFFWVYRRKS